MADAYQELHERLDALEEQVAARAARAVSRYSQTGPSLPMGVALVRHRHRP